MKKYILIACLLFFTSCVGQEAAKEMQKFDDRMKKIQEGMDSQKAIDIIGQPDAWQTVNKEFRTGGYYCGLDGKMYRYASVTFSGGQVSSIDIQYFNKGREN